MLLGLCSLVFMAGVQSATVSILTDEISHNNTSPQLNEIKNVDIFRQLLNQETIVRIALVKNVHTLMKDMLTLQEKMAKAEDKSFRIETSTNQEILELKKQVEILKDENAELKNKIAVSENEINTLKENLENVSNALTDLKVEVRYLSITVFGINDDFKDIDERLQELLKNSTKAIESEIRINIVNNTATISELETRHLTLIDDIKKQTNFLKSNIEEYKANQLKISASVSSLELFRANQTLAKCDPKETVAFTAAVTTASTTWNSGTLIFNVIISNIGNGYNPSNGVFTAPIAGTYVFYVSALEYSNQYLGLEIVLNNVSKVRLIGESSTTYQTGTNMVVLILQKGDGVWVKHHHGTGYYSADVPVTTFTGFLIGRN